MREDVNALDLEEKIAGDVAAYVRHLASGAEKDPADSLRWICAGLERLLTRCLHMHRVWPASTWCDGILHAEAEMVSPVELFVRGTAVWNEKREAWCDPFQAELRISTDGRFLSWYNLRFGDRRQGLRLARYGESYGVVDPRRQDRRWLHEFTAEEVGTS